MRKSAAVKLTLVPILAASALAYAQAPGDTHHLPLEWLDDAPGYIEPVLSPPGMTPTIDELDCDTDPNVDDRTDCQPVEMDDPDGTGVMVVRGGYGHYFWSGGG